MPSGRKRKQDVAVESDSEAKIVKKKEKRSRRKSNVDPELLQDELVEIPLKSAKRVTRSKNLEKTNSIPVAECSVKLKTLSQSQIERAISPCSASVKPKKAVTSKVEAKSSVRDQVLNSDDVPDEVCHSEKTGNKKRHGHGKKLQKTNELPAESDVLSKRTSIKRNLKFSQLSDSDGISEEEGEIPLKNKQPKRVNKSTKAKPQKTVSKQKKKVENACIIKAEDPSDIEVHEQKKKQTKKHKQISPKKVVEKLESQKPAEKSGPKTEDDSSSSESDWEEVKEEGEEEDALESYNPEIPKEGVEITLEGPKIVRRRPKKEFDTMEFIRLQINRGRKEAQLNRHKVHLLCLVAHGMYLNNILNTPEVNAHALSMIPVEFHGIGKKTGKVDLEAIQKLMNWFCDAFSAEKKYRFYHVSVHKLCKSFEQRKVSNVQEYNMLFLVVARTLGLSVRLCHSLYPISFKTKDLLKKPKDNGKDTSTVIAESLMKAKLKKLLGTGESSSEAKEENNEVGRDIGIEDSKESILETVKGCIETKEGKDVKKKLKSGEKVEESAKNENDKGSFKKDNEKTKLKTKNVKAKIKSSKSVDVKPVKSQSQVKNSTEAESKRPKRSVGAKDYKLDSEDSGADDSEDDFSAKMLNKSANNNSSSVAGSSKKKQQIKSESKLISKKSSKKNRKILSSDSENSGGGSTKSVIMGMEYWLEIYCKATKKWISVECYNRIINKPYAIEKVATQPVTYVIAIDNSSFVKDVTKRYCSEFLTETRKLRPDPEWWDEALASFLPPNTKEDREEESQMAATLLTKPLPKTIGEYKNHPLYALKRHLLKFEALYPADVQPVGFIRSEAVYPREAVHSLHSRETWVKEARMVRVGEEPYKIVKARPKWDRMTNTMKTDLPLELFGYWQTEEYMPPIAYNGKVPRNEYGNVELFKPCMLPIGTVHLQLPGINRIAKKLGIDCASAVVGFDLHKGSSHPVIDGYVICEEFQDIVMDAWNEEQENIQKREEEKREKRIYGNWRKLIRGLLIREKIKIKYAVD